VLGAIFPPVGGPACEGSAPAPNQHRAERRAVLRGASEGHYSLASDLLEPDYWQNAFSLSASTAPRYI
jgi:hypothetical protein